MHSEEEEKGSNCFDQFREMFECHRQFSDRYPDSPSLNLDDIGENKQLSLEEKETAGSVAESTSEEKVTAAADAGGEGGEEATGTKSNLGSSTQSSVEASAESNVETSAESNVEASAESDVKASSAGSRDTDSSSTTTK